MTEQDKEETTLQGLKILWVKYGAHWANQHALALKDAFEGTEVIFVETANAALDLLESDEKFDLLIVDPYIAEGTSDRTERRAFDRYQPEQGFELLDRIQELHRELPPVIITADPPVLERSKERIKGYTEFVLANPFGIEELSLSVEKALQR